MKKLLILFICLLLSKLTFSQYFLGETRIQVLQDAEKADAMKLREQTDSDGRLEIKWEDYTTKSSMDAIFCGDLVCVFYIMPHDHESADAWVTSIDKSYATYGENEWKGYSNGNPFYVKVGTFVDSSFFFRFTYTDK
jgi:hypothetical protein